MGTKFNPFTGNFDIVGEGAATGTVIGPGSSTDNAIARFDGTGGTTIKNSTVTLGNTGAIQNTVTADVVGLTLKGSASQTVNLFEIRNSANTLVTSGNAAGMMVSTSFASSGGAYMTGLTFGNTGGGAQTITFNNGPTGPSMAFTDAAGFSGWSSFARFITSEATVPTMRLQNKASQTAALLQFANSSAVVMADVNAAGSYGGPSVRLNGATSGTLTQQATAVTTDHTLTWPAAQGGADTFLKNNGSGVLSWASAGGTTIATFENSDLAPDTWGNDVPSLVFDGTTTDATNAFGAGLMFKGHGNQGYMLYLTEDVTGTDPSSSHYFGTGWSTNITESSATGDFQVETGTKPDGSFDGNTGQVYLFSGLHGAVTGSSGSVRLGSGNSLYADSGNVVLSTGTAVNGARGVIEFDAPIFRVPTTVTAGGTTGTQTIDKISGTVNIASTESSKTVNNTYVGTNSLVFCVIRTNDNTAVLKNVVPGVGSFVINLTAAATAEISVGFFVVNGA